ncbi:ABC transporter ATP-binding protein [Candidatus Uhrbacteria bacterium]|jgi:ABC-type multidrug transport system fused ATPase/permease subunit|nr:ABC transporter ATP-binding protein [Candidatus Uhrbacteria bacterium]
MSHDIEDEERKVAGSYMEYISMMIDSIGVVKWIWSELVDDVGRRKLKQMAGWLTVFTTFILVPSWLLGEVVDSLIAGDAPAAYKFLWIMAGCIVASQIANAFQMVAREWALGSIMGKVDSRMSELFFDKSLGQHLQEGGKLSAANVEKARGRVWSVVDMLLFQGTSSMLHLLVSYSLLWLISPVAGGIMTILFVHYLCWMLFLNRRVMVACTPLDAKFRKHNRYRTNRWDLVERVLNTGKGDEEIAYMNQWFDVIIKEDRAFWIWYIMMSNFRAFMRIGALIGVAAYGIWSIDRGVMEISLLIPLFVWSQGVADNLWRIGQIERMLNWNLPSIKSMMDALTIKNDIVIKPNAVKIADSAPLGVELRGIGHAYPADDGGDGERRVLHDLAFKIEPGEKVALIGASGAGKSTLMRLLLRYMDPDSGAVLYNGVDLRDVDLDHLRRMIGYIAQRPPVLDDTIRENIMYRIPRSERGSITDEFIWSVLESVQLALHKRFDKGLDTRVGKNGVKLSGGEQQRLMIAAAIIQRPRFIIIDEATSSLDAVTEKLVQSGLEKVLGPETTAVVIAHRFSTLQFCDRIVVLRPVPGLDEGEPQIEAIGDSFSELYKVSPTFRGLADGQGLHIAV